LKRGKPPVRTPIRKKPSSAKPRKVSITQAKKKADSAFSIFIRTRDSVNGVCTCATCGAKVPLKSAHAGHFISRKDLSTRFDERNVNAQCFACNIHRKGEQYRHSLYIDEKHGSGTSIELLEKSRQIKQMKAQDYLDIARDYKLLTEELTSPK
jgi:5-methylcytosine-specific restriction endonuclease McrA